MASSITRIECGICLEEYNTTRRPRTLPCGHNFCGDCLQNCIEQGSNNCSICRKTHTATTVDDIPINTEFETVIQLNRSLMLRNTVQTNESSDEDDDFSNGRCSRHKKSLLYFKCETHSIYICRECAVIEHSPTKCNIIEIKEEVLKTKDDTLMDAQKRVDHLDSAKTTIETIIKQKNYSITRKEGKIESLLKEIDDECNVRDKAEKDTIEIKNIARQLKEFIESLKKSTTKHKIDKETLELQEKVKTCERLLEELKGNYDIEDSSKYPLKSKCSSITIESLREIVTNSAEEVWACMEMKNKKFSAKIIMLQGHLLLKSLSKRAPPPNAVVIPYHKVKSLVKRNNITIFLEIYTSKISLIHIKLFANEVRTQQFELMCTGEVDGISYANTTFLDIEGSPYVGIWGGARNDGSESALPGFQPGNLRKYRITQGLVAADNHYSEPNKIRKPTHFKIYSEELPENYYESEPIGKVVLGMNSFQNAYLIAKFIGARKIRITDCGIVLVL
ncbi:unnamed protein product, partial [Meganyctiphanes norvegica]